METILIVEDDPHTQELMTIYLQSNGYQTTTATNGKEALMVLDQQRVSLILVDIMMPEMDGYELTKLLRETNYQQPILMVTAKETASEKKKGFLVGTDDYMTKPVDQEEMLLRIKALLRRSKIAAEHQITIGALKINAETLSVIKGADSIFLPQKEFFLLFKLLSYPDKIFTRIQLMDEIWGYDSQSTSQTVNVHINRLREKFTNFSEFQIVTVRGLGYKGVITV